MTTIEINDNYLKYVNKLENINYSYKGYLIYLFVIIIATASIILLLLEVYEWDPLMQFSTVKRIKNNVNNWIKLIVDTTHIESNRGRIIAAGRPDVFGFSCYDMGTYYVAGRLDSTTFLPEFIQRGSGDVWRFSKAASVDVSAEQFCKFNIYQGNNNILTCGTSMFYSMGYSGYFETDHPCQLFLSKIV